MKGSILRRAHLGVQTMTIHYLCEWKFQPAAFWVITWPATAIIRTCMIHSCQVWDTNSEQSHTPSTELFIPNIKIYYHYYSPLFWGQVRVISVYRTVVCFAVQSVAHQDPIHQVSTWPGCIVWQDVIWSLQCSKHISPKDEDNMTDRGEMDDQAKTHEMLSWR